MCLAIPARIVDLRGKQAVVDVDGVQRSIQTDLLTGLQVGDYVIVHAGFAIQKWSEQDVAEYRAIMEEMERLDQGLAPEGTDD
ncbi:HypC/HybG/HupF family hydrogenase formation chaperone [candidate division FCPU426 bacterium]|nr:HypC/HybG/HupF family hydrogenase formation chaperone [candidate division FCPU426 bacterium]